jgi:hypothetical protein
MRPGSERRTKKQNGKITGKQQRNANSASLANVGHQKAKLENARAVTKYAASLPNVFFAVLSMFASELEPSIRIDVISVIFLSSGRAETSPSTRVITDG